MATNYTNPVLKTNNHKITSGYGTRTLNGVTAHHNGVDLTANGSADYIIAIADGTCSISKNSDTAGQYIEVDHGSNIKTRYLHMKTGSRTKSVGDSVKKGDVLGYMGATGSGVTGVHLHFDVKISGSDVDPVPYLNGTKSINGNSSGSTTTSGETTYRTYTDGAYLPWVTGYNTSNSNGYAGSFGKDITGLQIDGATYQVHTKDGKWLGFVTGYSDDYNTGFAGDHKTAIDCIRISGKTYRVHLKDENRWLPAVTGYNTTDDNGYAGVYGKEIDAIQIYD